MNNHSFTPNNRIFSDLLNAIFSRRAVLWAAILITALVGFEMFNFSTTQYALDDLLGQIRFAGLRWSTILALAFCGIDFAGIARLFTPESGRSTSREAWYLFAAWLLAATMNAILTWWGVSMALANHTVASTYIINPNILSRGVPVFIALVVWVTRFLLISTLASVGNRDDYPAAQRVNQPRSVTAQSAAPRPAVLPRSSPPTPALHQQQASSARRPQPAPTSAMRPTLMVPPRAQPEEKPHARQVANPPQPISTNQPRPTPPQPRVQPKPANRPTFTPNPAPKIPAPPLRPTEPPVEEPAPPEPEYIPDPFYSQPSFHSLTARSASAPKQPKSLL